jgi:ABC-type oligopeptide transport system substrate-binding subunit
MLQKKSMLASGLCALAILAAGAQSASAGEVTGNGKDTAGPEHANSICVYSGKNDNPDAPQDNPDAGGVSQSYGQLNRLGIVDEFDLPNPGVACRGGSNEDPEG